MLPPKATLMSVGLTAAKGHDGVVVHDKDKGCDDVHALCCHQLRIEVRDPCGLEAMCMPMILALECDQQQE